MIFMLPICSIVLLPALWVGMIVIAALLIPWYLQWLQTMKWKRTIAQLIDAKESLQ